MVAVRADIAELFAGLSVADVWQLSTSATTAQRLHVRTRVAVEREPRTAKPRKRDPARRKAEHEALRADPAKWEAVKAANNAYRRERRVRKGHARKLDDAAVDDIRTSTDSVSALARKYGVDRAAIRYHRKATR